MKTGEESVKLGWTLKNGEEKVDEESECAQNGEELQRKTEMGGLCEERFGRSGRVEDNESKGWRHGNGSETVSVMEEGNKSTTGIDATLTQISRIKRRTTNYSCKYL